MPAVGWRRAGEFWLISCLGSAASPGLSFFGSGEASTGAGGAGAASGLKVNVLKEGSFRMSTPRFAFAAT